MILRNNNIQISLQELIQRFYVINIFTKKKLENL
jgi:hypothetical protein